MRFLLTLMLALGIAVATQASPFVNANAVLIAGTQCARDGLVLAPESLEPGFRWRCVQATSGEVGERPKYLSPKHTREDFARTCAEYDAALVIFNRDANILVCTR